MGNYALPQFPIPKIQYRPVFGSVGASELVEEAVMDGLDSPVSLPLIHQDGDLDLAGGDHVNVDSGRGVVS